MMILNIQLIKKIININLKSNIEIKDNPFKIDFLGYQKDENLKSKINLNGLFIPEKK